MKLHEENVATNELIHVLDDFIGGSGTNPVENDVDVGDGVSMEHDNSTNIMMNYLHRLKLNSIPVVQTSLH